MGAARRFPSAAVLLFCAAVRSGAVEVRSTHKQLYLHPIRAPRADNRTADPSSEDVATPTIRVNATDVRAGHIHAHGTVAVARPTEPPNWWLIAPGPVTHAGPTWWLLPLIIGCLSLSLGLVLTFVMQPKKEELPMQDSKQASKAEEVPKAPQVVKERIALYDNFKMIAIAFVAMDHALLYVPLNTTVPASLVRLTLSNTDSTPGVIEAIISLLMNYGMQGFFFVSGLTASAELTKARFFANVTGIAVPPVLVGAWKLIFFYKNMITWRVGRPFVEAVVNVAGFPWLVCRHGSRVSLDEDRFSPLPIAILFPSQMLQGGTTIEVFWFNMTLFILRAIVLPTIGNARTVVLIPLTLASYLVFILNSTGSIADGAAPNTYFARAFIFLPYFIAGFLVKRHKIAERLLLLLESNATAYYVLKSLASGWLILLIGLAFGKHKSLSNLLKISGAGCHDLEKLTAMPVWPDTDRLQHVGCITGYWGISAINFAVMMIIVPSRHLGGWTRAGAHTLTGYMFNEVR